MGNHNRIHFCKSRNKKSAHPLEGMESQHCTLSPVTAGGRGPPARLAGSRRGTREELGTHIVTQVGNKTKPQHRWWVMGRGRGLENNMRKPAPGDGPRADAELKGWSSKSADRLRQFWVPTLRFSELCSHWGGRWCVERESWCSCPVRGGTGGHQSDVSAAGIWLPPHLLQARVGGENNSVLRSKRSGHRPQGFCLNTSDSISFSKCSPLQGIKVVFFPPWI